MDFNKLGFKDFHPETEFKVGKSPTKKQAVEGFASFFTLNDSDTKSEFGSGASAHAEATELTLSSLSWR